MQNRRRKLRIAAMCWEENNGQMAERGTELITHEVSIDGIWFHCDHIYPLGTTLVAEIYLPSREDPISCKLKVTQVETTVHNEQYIIGTSYIQIDPNDGMAIVAWLEKLDLGLLLENVLSMGASDVHLTVGHPPMVRRDGKILPLDGEIINEGEVEAMLYPLLTNEQIEFFEQRHELDFAFSPDLNSRFRVNLHWQRGFVEAALRNIPTQVKTFDELRLPAAPLRNFCNQKSGLVLIAGTTGAGKTTTMSAIVNYINATQRAMVITVEDPIEYLHTSRKSIVKQRELGTDTFSYAEALRRVLRQDPDVICVGELLDGECLLAAMRAAETGHLVISTIHAPDTVQAIQRAVNFFPPEHSQNVCLQLASCLVGILFQVLLPSTTGGRVPATELLINNSAIRNLIREAKFSRMSTVLQTGRAQGMYTLKSSLNDLLERELIDPKTLESFKQLEYLQ